MRRLIQFGFVLGALAGCQHSPSALPSDPILVSKRPLLSKPDIRPPSVVAKLEPAAPARQTAPVAPAAESVALLVRSQAPE